MFRGAEAVLTRKGSMIVKERIQKGYRIGTLDMLLRKKRTKTEIRLMREARRAGVLVPRIIDESDFSISMEFIEGTIIKDELNENSAIKIGKKIGIAIAQLHSYDIIHGDLTTSNMILKNGMLFFIDFGLGFQSRRVEDKANDIYLLKEIIDSTHVKIRKVLWEIILKTYRENYRDAGVVIKTLAAIEKRGRYKEK